MLCRADRDRPREPRAPGSGRDPGPADRRVSKARP